MFGVAFGCVGTFILCMGGTFMNQVSPSWSVRCCSFPCCNVDVEVLHVDFEGVFVALTLASYFSATIAEFTVQQLLGYPAAWHTTNVSCPSSLSFAHGGNDSVEVCSLQNLGVRNLVLPIDVENVAETPEMELLKKFLMSSANGPSFTAVVKCC